MIKRHVSDQWLHLHLQRGEQTILAFAHVQFEQFPLHEHLTSSRHALDTSGIVIQTGAQELDVLVQE